MTPLGHPMTVLGRRSLIAAASGAAVEIATDRAADRSRACCITLAANRRSASLLSATASGSVRECHGVRDPAARHVMVSGSVPSEAPGVRGEGHRWSLWLVSSPGNTCATHGLTFIQIIATSLSKGAHSNFKLKFKLKSSYYHNSDN